MLSLPANLWNYFGVVGLLAVAVWLVLLVWVIRFALRGGLLGIVLVASVLLLMVFGLAVSGGWSSQVLLVGWVVLGLGGLMYLLSARWDGVGLLAVAVVAVSLSWWNSQRVSSIEALPSDKQTQLDEKARQQRLEMLTSHASSVRYAEDTEEDRLDLAGVTDAKYKSIYEAAAAGAPEVPLYRQGGKVERDEGRKRTDADTKALTEQAAVTGVDEARKLPEQEVIAAQRYDRTNLFITRFLFLLAGLTLLIDYVRRLNRTDDALLPLPLSGRLLDAVSPKSLVVHLQATEAGVVERYVRRAVGRGESFLYFGATHPLKDEPTTLPRLSLTGIGDAGRGVCLRARVARLGLWPMKLYTVANLTDVPGPKFLLETLWFTRASFVVLGDACGRAVLASALEHLTMRHVPRARVRRTVHLIWHSPEPMSAAVGEDLEYLCRSAQMKLVVVSDHPCPEGALSFDERLVL